jgi:mannose-6-phosphate isomerase-like protein (cupin superfamily)
MNNVDRRRFASMLAFSSLAAGSRAVSAQTEPPPPSADASPKTAAGAGTLGPARAIPLEQMQERKTPSGEGWSIAHGTLATGESVNLHQSMQVAGAPPAQPHVIQHTEFVLVREGEVEFVHEAGGQMLTERVGPGGVIYIAFGTKHAVRNVGSAPARYFVVAIGGDAK